MLKTFGEILARFNDDHAYDGSDVIEALNAARDAVGGDPAEWWVEDADGNRLKIGDKFKHHDNTEYEVFALGPERVIYDIGHFFNSVRADLVHKVIHDTREKVIEDTLAKLTPYGVGGGKVAEAIEDAVDRAMKLPEVDA